MWNPSDYKNNTALGHKGIDINEERRRVLINNICSMTKQHACRCVKIKFLKFYSKTFLDYKVSATKQSFGQPATIVSIG